MTTNPKMPRVIYVWAGPFSGWNTVGFPPAADKMAIYTQKQQADKMAEALKTIVKWNSGESDYVEGMFAKANAALSDYEAQS